MKAKTLVDLGDELLISDPLRLALISDADTKLIRDLFCDEDTAQKVLLRPALQTEPELKQTLQQLLSVQTYAICFEGETEPVGIIGLQPTRGEDATTLSFFAAIQSKHRRQGYCTGAMRLLFSRVFATSQHEEIGAWTNLDFFQELQPIYEHWKFHPTLLFTLMQMLDSSAGSPLGYYVLERENFLRSFPRAAEQPARISGAME